MIYVTGNLFPNKSRATCLKNCSDLDKEDRKLLTQISMLQKRSAKISVYLPTILSGLGLKSIRLQTEVQLIKKCTYLQNHQDMTNTKNKFMRLAKKGWRNPITDAEKIYEQYTEIKLGE